MFEIDSIRVTWIILKIKTNYITVRYIIYSRYFNDFELKLYTATLVYLCTGIYKYLGSDIIDQ